MCRLVMSCAVAAVVNLAFGPSADAEDLSVLPAEIDGQPTNQMLRRWLKDRVAEAFERRRQRYESLKTPEQIADYQRRLREFFIEQLGGLPERTPLNPRIVGRLDHELCRVEKIIFESRPKHFVTAALYLPKSQPPYPAVIVPCGHTPNGKAADAYQRICIFLAHSGIATLCYDPIGQGERYQLLDADGKPRFKSTTEHTLVGIGSILVGRNAASYRVWDGIRALDFLESRENINAEQLGCAGNSGGGTLTEYLMALDPRIQCAAPSCCVTTFARRLETIGPGDAEQNIFGQIGFGLDHADYTLMRAPRPTLLCTATHDFVDIHGSWDIFRETKRVYSRLGFAERVDLIEVDGPHGLSQPKREAIVRWMRRWLLGIDKPVTELEFAVFTARELQCSPGGQVQLIDGARSVMDLNMDVVEQSDQQRRDLWNADDQNAAIAKVRRVTGVRPLSALPRPAVHSTGEVPREGYAVEKLALTLGDGMVLPALLLRPEKPTGRRVLYLHESGKHADAEPGGPMEQLVHAGTTVFAVDVRGCGETGGQPNNLWGGDWYETFLAYLLGKSMLGLRTEDTLIAARHLAELDDHADCKKMEMIAVGVLTPPALHAAALENEMFERVLLYDEPSSWLDTIREPDLRRQLVNAVHAAQLHYNQSDLQQSLVRAGVVVETILANAKAGN